MCKGCKGCTIPEATTSIARKTFPTAVSEPSFSFAHSFSGPFFLFILGKNDVSYRIYLLYIYDRKNTVIRFPMAHESRDMAKCFSPMQVNILFFFIFFIFMQYRAFLLH